MVGIYQTIKLSVQSMKKQVDYIILGASILFSASNVMAGPPPPAEMRDWQYCEIIIYTDNTSNNGAYQNPVFNTTGYSNCGNWQVINANDIVTNYNAQFPTGGSTTPAGGTASSVDLNFPRHWVMDSVQESTAGTDSILFTDGIAIGFAGYHEGVVAEPYVPQTIARTTVWTYNKGSLVYELIDPNGNTYVMQSYAQFIDKRLTIKKLPFIKRKLKLPAGWRYHARKLTAQLNLVANGYVTVINDGLRNTYQLNPNP